MTRTTVLASRVVTVGLLLHVALAAAQAPINEVPDVSGLLHARRFSELDLMIGQALTRYRADYRYERDVDLLLNQLYTPVGSMSEPLDEWVATSGTPIAHLARGVYETAMGFDSRGAAFARETTDSQFAGMREHFAAAAADLSEALSAEPNQVHAYCYVIEIATALGQRRAARDAFDRAIAANPRTLTARWYYLGALRPRWGGSIPQMEELIEEARAFFDENPELRILEGRMNAEVADDFMTARDYSAALAEFTLAIERGGPFWYYHYRRGEAAMRLRQYPAAIEDLTEALRLWPGYGTAYEYRGRSHFSMGDYAAAIVDLTAGIDRGRDTAQVFAIRGDAHARSGRHAEALADLDRALELEPNDPAYRALRERTRGQLDAGVR